MTARHYCNVAVRQLQMQRFSFSRDSKVSISRRESNSRTRSRSIRSRVAPTTHARSCLVELLFKADTCFRFPNFALETLEPKADTASFADRTSSAALSKRSPLDPTCVSLPTYSSRVSSQSAQDGYDPGGPTSQPRGNTLDLDMATTLASKPPLRVPDFPLTPQSLERWIRFSAKGGIGRATAKVDRVSEDGESFLMMLEGDEIVVLMDLGQDIYLVRSLLLSVARNSTGKLTQYLPRLFPLYLSRGTVKESSASFEVKTYSSYSANSRTQSWYLGRGKRNPSHPRPRRD